MPAGKLGMWLFLASEAMFFVGLLGAFIVLESAGEQHELFVKSSQMLSKWIGGVEVAMLLVSSLALRGSRKILRWVAITTAIIFLLLQSMQWRLLLHHHTAVVWNSGTLQVVDGYPIGPSMLSNGHQMDMPDKFDIHTITLSDFPNHEYMGHGVYMEQKPNQDLNYGPSRNNFFACYFLMSAAHVLHLLAGLVAVLWFMLFAKGKLPVAVQIYWHFVNAVGVVAFLALYFV